MDRYSSDHRSLTASNDVKPLKRVTDSLVLISCIEEKVVLGKGDKAKLSR